MFIVQMTAIVESFKELNNKFKYVLELKKKVEQKKDELDEDDGSFQFLDGFF